MRIPLILRQLDQAFDHKSWHGTNLRGALRAVDAETATWRPAPGRHNIAEIVLHSAYWKFAIRKRLTGDRRATFPLAGEDWFDVSDPIDEQRWAELIAVLDSEHRQLCRAIRQAERDLEYGSRAGRELVRKLFGIAMHDAYHTGQIHLIQAQQKRVMGT